MPQRRSKTAPEPGEKRARTRVALLAAATELIAEEGYEQLSMDRVAARAGMTKGAIYGNFADKEALIMAAFLAGSKRTPPPLSPGGTLADQLALLAESLIAQGSDARRAATRLLAFQLYALTHEEMRARVAAENGEVYQRLEAWIRRVLPMEELPMSPRQFVRMLHALSDGLLVTHALAPDLVTADVVRATFAALARAKPVPGNASSAVRARPRRRTSSGSNHV
jgi:AcrR family transcriptional regulator